MDSSERLIHSCDQIPSEGVSIRVGTACFDGENLGWCLFIERLAAEEDLLENHYLEEVGESIWTTVVEIKFCPYCAVELVDVDPGRHMSHTASINSRRGNRIKK
jgi:hypothetical protein